MDDNWSQYCVQLTQGNNQDLANSSNRLASQMRALLAACRELAMDYDTLFWGIKRNMF